MIDRYYRKVIKSIDDLKYKLKLADMTLKINKNYIDIEEIKKDISKINNFSETNSEYNIDYIQLFEIGINKDFKFNRSSHKFEIFEEYILDKKFTVGYIEIFFSITIFYSNLTNDYHRLNINFILYDENENIIYDNVFNTFNHGNEILKSVLYQNNFYVPIYNDISILKIKVLITRYNPRGIGIINVKITDKDAKNYIYIKYLKKNKIH